MVLFVARALLPLLLIIPRLFFFLPSSTQFFPHKEDNLVYHTPCPVPMGLLSLLPLQLCLLLYHKPDLWDIKALCQIIIPSLELLLQL